MTIREARPEDWEAIWPFFRRIVAAGETYAYDREMSEAEGRLFLQAWHLRQLAGGAGPLSTPATRTPPR